jgi:predicted DCC family thiol-disulfide oxidoreductase YuxK
MNKYPVPFVIYDDQCILCVRFKQAFEKSSQKSTLHFVPLSDDEVFGQYQILDKAQCQKEIHMVKENLEILKGPEVLEYLLQNMPWCQPFLWLIESENGKKALNYFYQKSDMLREKLKRDCGTCL